MRNKIYRFLKRMSKVPEGERLPWYLITIKVILFPLHSYCALQNGIKYDFSTDIYTIEGMKYTRELFMDWAEGGLKVGQLFRIVHREDGVITIATEGERKGDKT